MATKELAYNVYMEEFNDKEIRIVDIFKFRSFYNRLVEIKKKNGDDFDTFSKEVRSTVQYYFWSKSEFEIILTSWPPYAENEEIERLVAEKDDHINKYGYFYRTNVKLTVARKIDIYDQVMLNWDIFIAYLWENRDLLKKKKA